MTQLVVDLQDVVGADVARVGGKGASLGELMRIEGVRVPPGFCVTTDAVRSERLEDEVRAAVEAYGAGTAFAVRSSATAEDAVGASFAGQHDSFLDVVGADAVLEHVRRCWASAFTERAVAYRALQGLDEAVEMAVVVQRMVPADAAGVLFTADPVTGNRRVSAVEAVAGLGDALVSGQVVPDAYTVRDGAVAGTDERPVLTEAQVVRLERLGRRIEAHFGRPQDIEWCLAGDEIHIVQSRPITTLFPVPDAGDDEPHVYLSVGHQQMMTDAMKPLGRSLWQQLAKPRMYEAGSRLFVDVAPGLASAATRDAFLAMFGTGDPLTAGALREIVDRGIVPLVPDDGTPPMKAFAPTVAPIETDRAIVTRLVARAAAANAAAAAALDGLTGPASLDAVLADLEAFKALVFDPESAQVYMTAMAASEWLDAHLGDWLGVTHAADALTLSAPDNVSSEMGLALLDVADAVRPHPEVVAHLRDAVDDGFLEGLDGLAGGPEARTAISAFLDRYGMRCVGEIDITRPRWSERPTALVPLILADVDSFAPGESARRVAAGRQAALAAERDLLERVRALPDGAAKAEETKAMIDRVRTFIGYREHPKYEIVARFAVYKRAIMREVRRLVDAGVLDGEEDAFFLAFAELQEVARSQEADARLIAERRAAFREHESLTPPRVLTHEGEVVTGTYDRDDVPEGALVGLAVSSGTVEGRARVVRDVAAADVGPGDILVTAFTDPSWSPLFVAIDGLVTEAGGRMSHGAVVAREYGLPAVVGVEHATTLIRDGQRIRVHGADGFVELLPEAP